MEQNPIILFDGVCNYCNSVVNFVIRQDKKNIFRFSPLQSPMAQRLLEQYGLPASRPDSMLLIDSGRIYHHSSAVLRLYQRLPWYWKWTQLFWIIPKFIRDAVYDFIARNRYKWFGKKEECMVPGDDVKERFI